MSTPQDEMRPTTLDEATRFIDIDADLIDDLGRNRLIEAEKVSRVLRKHAANVRAAIAAQAEALAAVTRERDALRAAGAKLANISFNFAQRVGHQITERDAELMAESRKAWDAVPRATLTPTAQGAQEQA